MSLKEQTFAVIAEKQNSISHKWFNQLADGELNWQKGAVLICDKGEYFTYWMWTKKHSDEAFALLPHRYESEFEDLIKKEDMMEMLEKSVAKEESEEKKIHKSYVIRHAMSPAQIEAIQNPEVGSFVYSNGDSGEIINAVGYWEFADKWRYKGLDYLSIPKESIALPNAVTIKPAVKPPLAVIPKEMHDRIRFDDLNEAIKRFCESDLEIPLEWVKERNDYLNK